MIVAVCPPVPVPDKDEAAGENLRVPDESPPVPIAADDCVDQNPLEPDQCPPIPVPDKDAAAGENLHIPDESPPVPITDDDCAEDQNPPDPDQCPPVPDQNPSVPVVVVMASVCM